MQLIKGLKIETTMASRAAVAVYIRSTRYVHGEHLDKG
uniref:Uncharacterized protein n=1 Tax=Anguilla anguilla TaxID=7936 RepID=A0A0E9UI94_ANGAN